MLDFLKKDRVKKAFEYMGKLANLKPEDLQSAQEKVTALFSHDQLNKALELPGGEKTEGWRYAVRSYVLLKILAEYSGGQSLEAFAGARKDEVKTMSEPLLRHVILELLKIVRDATITISGKIYVDVNALEPTFTPNIFLGLPSPGFKLWVPKGNWKYVPYKMMNDEIVTVDFATEKYDGIYTTGASDCSVCAFIYGGQGGIIKVIKLVHLSGSQTQFVPNWPTVTANGQPTAVIFNTRNGPDSAGVSAIKEKLASLGVNVMLLTIHCAYGANFGVNKWGGFGDTDA